jgi:hypothetical protein
LFLFGRRLGGGGFRNPHARLVIGGGGHERPPQPRQTWTWLLERLRLDPALAARLDEALHIQLSHRSLGQHHGPVLPASSFGLLEPSRSPLLIVMGNRPVPPIVREPRHCTLLLHGLRARAQGCTKRFAVAVLVQVRLGLWCALSSPGMPAARQARSPQAEHGRTGGDALRDIRRS